MKEKVNLSITLPKDLFEEVEDKRKEMGLTRSGFISYIIYQYFSKSK